MSTPDLIGTGYVLLFLLIWRMAAGHFAYVLADDPARPDWGEGAFAGFWIAIFWPVALPLLCAITAYHKIPPGFSLWPVPVGAERGGRKRARAAVRDRKIKAGERECGIGDHPPETKARVLTPEQLLAGTPAAPAYCARCNSYHPNTTPCEISDRPPERGTPYRPPPDLPRVTQKIDPPLHPEHVKGPVVKRGQVFREHHAPYNKRCGCCGAPLGYTHLSKCRYSSPHDDLGLALVTMEQAFENRCAMCGGPVGCPHLSGCKYSSVPERYGPGACPGCGMYHPQQDPCPVPPISPLIQPD